MFEDVVKHANQLRPMVKLIQDKYFEAHPELSAEQRQLITAMLPLNQAQEKNLLKIASTKFKA